MNPSKSIPQSIYAALAVYKAPFHSYNFMDDQYDITA